MVTFSEPVGIDTLSNDASANIFSLDLGSSTIGGVVSGSYFKRSPLDNLFSFSSGSDVVDRFTVVVPSGFEATLTLSAAAVDPGFTTDTFRWSFPTTQIPELTFNSVGVVGSQTLSAGTYEIDVAALNGTDTQGKIPAPIGLQLVVAPANRC